MGLIHGLEIFFIQGKHLHPMNPMKFGKYICSICLYLFFCIYEAWKRSLSVKQSIWIHAFMKIECWHLNDPDP